MAKVTFIPGSGTLAAYLSGEIDHHAAQSLRREIDAQIDDRLPELLTLDFSGVTFMDSSGVGAYSGARPAYRRAGRTADRPESAPGGAANARSCSHNLRLNGGKDDEDAQSGQAYLRGALCQ